MASTTTDAPESARKTGQKVWFVTGTSSGFGYHIATHALAKGDLVIATGRDTDKLQNLFFGPSDEDEPAANDPDAPITGAPVRVQISHPENLRILKLDVTASFDTIQAVAKEAVEIWGRVDVLVNNAGYGVLGIIEEIGPEGFQRQYATNLFGVIHVTTAFLPYLRTARRGSIIQIGSRLAWHADSPGDSLYASSKAAVHAFSESLAAEMRPFNVQVCIFQPGGFLTTNTATAPFHNANQITDYDEMRAKGLQGRVETPRKFVGDPAKCMAFLVDLVRGEGKAGVHLREKMRKEGKERADGEVELPMHLVCGPFANESVRRKLVMMEDVLDQWEWATREMIMDGKVYNPA